MKHILPILTAALLCATSTASAAYYYDYYLNPPNTEPVNNDINGYHNQSDSFTYGTRDFNGIEVEDSNVFTLKRESNWGNDITRYGNKDNFFRIDVPDTNTEKITLYLTDYVSEVVPQAAFLPTHSSSNALFNMDIAEYGYRELTLVDGKYVPGETITKDILIADENGKIVDSKGNRYSLSSNVTPIDSIDYYDDSRSMIRYKYELGTFDPNTIIEVYMKDTEGREVYSFSSFSSDEDGNSEYTPFDKNDPSDDVVSNGGFGDGGYRVAARVTDKMLYSYYFMEEFDDGRKNADFHEYEKFDPNQTLAAGKAMPLSELVPIGNINTLGLGTAVQFGIIGETFGSPLPGGLQIALIAGLSGLGLWYIRRRKTIAA